MGKKNKIKIAISMILMVAALVCCVLNLTIGLGSMFTIRFNLVLLLIAVFMILWDNADYINENRRLSDKNFSLRIRVGELLMVEEENEKLKEEIQELKKTIKNQNISIGMYKHNSKIKSQKSESSDNRG